MALPLNASWSGPAPNMSHIYKDSLHGSCRKCIHYPLFALTVWFSGVTSVGVTRGGKWWVSPIFSSKNLTTFLVIASGKWWPFSAVVSSPLPSSHVVYPLFFLYSAKQIILVRCHPLDGVTPGGPPSRSAFPPCDTTGLDVLIIAECIVQ